MMKLVVSAVMVMALVGTVDCAPVCDVFCTFIYLPVCGTDGKTYGNACMLGSVNCGKDVQVAHNGTCETEVPCNSLVACTAEYNPVCGTDGVTYSNKCEFTSRTCGRNDVSIDYYGQCEQQTVPCNSFVACTLEWNPICGTDGVTYSNNCEFTAQTCGRNDVSIAYYGQCELDSYPCNSFAACTYDYTPVCGTDGVTYSNECEFTAQTCGRNDVSIAHNGSCEVTATPCDIFVMCTEQYEPVCGSNGVTYSNSCFFRSQTCGNGDVSIAHQGACDETTDVPCGIDVMCTDNYSPICGVNGVTYSNECVMNSQTCGNVAKAHEGECQNDATDNQ